MFFSCIFSSILCSFLFHGAKCSTIILVRSILCSFCLVEIFHLWLCHRFCSSVYFSLTRNHVKCKRRCRKGGPNANYCALRKELRGGSFQSLLSGSSSSVSSNSQEDPLLSYFICNPSEADYDMPIVQSLSTQKFYKEDSFAADVSDRYKYKFLLLILLLSWRSMHNILQCM